MRGGVRGSIDYSELGTAIKLGFVPDNKDINKPFTYFEVDKGSFGKDTITTEAGKIIGANSQVNTIDVSNLDPGNSLDLNLINNSLALNLAKGGTEKLEVNNFTNAVGTKGNDTIVGANNGGKLTGGGGSDTVTGGSGNDTIAGAGAGARGVGEVDTLTGGGGKDKFVLGDRNGGYYVGNGASDYALITDFNLFQDSISIGSLKDYSVAASGNNTIDLYAGKDASTCDLIAKIQLSSPLSIQAKTATKGMMGANSLNSIEPLSAGLNIISGDNTAETII